jgi:pyridoxine kinase
LIEFPHLDANFVGTGDLFAALSIAWFDKSGGDLKVTLEKVISTMQDILKRTLTWAHKVVPEGGKPTSGDLELKLVQSRDDILRAEVKFEATEI